jgi:hypothetical protein
LCGGWLGTASGSRRCWGRGSAASVVFGRVRDTCFSAVRQRLPNIARAMSKRVLINNAWSNNTCRPGKLKCLRVLVPSSRYCTARLTCFSFHLRAYVPLTLRIGYFLIDRVSQNTSYNFFSLHVLHSVRTCTCTTITHPCMHSFSFFLFCLDDRSMDYSYVEGGHILSI